MEVSIPNNVNMFINQNAGQGREIDLDTQLK